MTADLVTRIKDDPRYRALVRRRSRFSWLLAAIMFALYYGYIALVAFDKKWLGQPIGAGVTSLGIPVGIGLIVATVVLTALYVWRANRQFDAEMRQILQDNAQ